MFKIIGTVLIGLFSVSVVHATCTLLWDAPTTSEDGTPLTTPVARYEVWVGDTADPLFMIKADLEPITTWVLCADVGLLRGKYVALRAVSESQGTSTFSESLHNMPPGLADNPNIRGRD